MRVGGPAILRPVIPLLLRLVAVKSAGRRGVTAGTRALTRVILAPRARK